MLHNSDWRYTEKQLKQRQEAKRATEVVKRQKDRRNKKILSYALAISASLLAMIIVWSIS